MLTDDIAPDDHDDPGYARRSIQLDPADIASEYVRVPADLAYWAARAADAEQDYQIAKAARDATLNTALVAAFKLGVKPVDAATAQAKIQPQVREADLALAEADGQRRRMRAMVGGVKAKAECLVSYGAHVRAELRSGISP